MRTDKQIAAAATAFAERWQGRGYERGESQLFWADLLTNVYGVENLPSFIRYEERVSSMVDSTNFIDGHIPSTRVLIEQKSLGKDLRAPIPQSEGGKLTPFQQAKKYVANMPLSQHPKWIITCNFAEFLVYDMEQPNSEPEQIFLKDLGKEYYRLQFLVDTKSEHLTKEMQVSMKAGEIVGRIYEALLKQYDDNSPEALRWLNILCVRIVFCLYAEDAGVFRHDQFHDYLKGFDAEDLSDALIKLFKILNTPTDQRSRYLRDDLKAFPYTNGGLFEEEIEIPQFTEELKQTLLQNASLDFNWSEISPTIFGAVFESTLNPETRRSGGMHYTSIENIHKVIDPLFLNDLRHELDDILEMKVEKTRLRRLDEYQEKLASLTFLDPACGSGNFLTETYLSLRRLENEVLREKYHGQMMMGEFLNPVKVSIHQFYGIEINDFAVTVATTALWISEAQMLAETEKIIQHDIDFLPLKSYANIKEGNALRMDWSTLEKDTMVPYLYTKKLNVFQVESLPKEILSATTEVREPMAEYNKVYEELNVVAQEVEKKTLPEKQPPKPIVYDYIMGNPPFIGARMMAQGSWQKKDVEDLFGKIKDVQDLDYVCCWFKKAAQILQGKHTQVGFVSTNSISQGAQVPILWNILLNQYHIHINYAYQTFKWSSESSEKAAVHCVIIGFGYDKAKEKKLFTSNGQSLKVTNISPYLLEGDNTFVVSRKTPLCDVPTMNFGNQPRDGGNFVLTDEERDELLKKEPDIAKWIRPYIGAEEFIKQKSRWCLWLKNASPSDIKQSKILYERVNSVRQFRLSSSAKTTIGYANVPNSFAQVTQPEGVECLLVPRVSSERRKYTPIGFIKAGVVTSDAVQIVPEATLYHFGVLTSIVHMAWMRILCGRLKSDYRYSKEQVYNTFPWPTPTESQKAKIEQAAQAILDARSKYPNSSLADLYDEVTMPPDLRKAHQENDKAVMQAYGFDTKTMSDDSEGSIVAELFKLHQALIKQEK